MSEGRTIIGLATPQANPTVEDEFRRMLTGPLLPVVTRLTSRAALPAARLRAYFAQLRRSLESFDTMPLAAFGFACTGSSYLLGPEREDAATAALEAATGVPVITAAQAIRRELILRGAHHIGVLAPYPADIAAAAARYWTAAGIEVTTLERIELPGSDTRGIYAITPAQVDAALAKLAANEAELVLASGTGMPTLAAVQRQGLLWPLVSSNSCLAAELSRRTGHWPAGQPLDPAALSGMHSGS